MPTLNGLGLKISTKQKIHFEMEKHDRIFGKKITDTLLRNHFYTFSESLKLHNPKYKEIRLIKPKLQEPTEHYICPLCVTSQVVLLGNILMKFEEFTIDHVPPESIGGKAKLLTCQVCNNKAGEYEAELVEKLRLHTFGDRKEGSGIKKISVKKDSNDNILHKGFIKNGEDGIPFIDFPQKAKENNPELKYILKEFGAAVQEIQITIKTPDDEKLTKALLKSAYLLCFIHWGYEFIYSEIGYKIRKVLHGEEKYPIPLPIAFVDKTKQELPIGIGIIQKPTELQSYYVTIPFIKSSDNYTAIIIIPPPTKDGWNRLEEIHEFFTKNKGVVFDYEYTFQPGEQTLPQNLNGYTETWANFKK